MSSKFKKLYDKCFKGFSLIDLCTEKSRSRIKLINEYQTLAADFIKQRNYGEALYWLEKITEIDPTHADAWYQRGMALYHHLGCMKCNRGLPTETRPEIYYPFHQARKYSSNADVWFQLGIICSIDGYFKESSKNLSNAIKLDPTYLNKCYTTGIQYQNCGKYKLSFAFFDIFTKKEPQNADAWFKRGMALYNMFDLEKPKEGERVSSDEFKYRECNKSFKKACDLNPEDALAQYYYGISLCNYCKNCKNCDELSIQGKNKFQESITIAFNCFKRAEDLNPANSYYESYMKYLRPTLLARLRLFEKINQYLGSYGGGTSSQWMEKGFIYLMLNDIDNAEKCKKFAEDAYKMEDEGPGF
jgi:tetratricopeptide (TPR) repeat protein